ncbi:SPOR domain-containing protein [Hyphococcus sp.]|jgi:cell division protein FtsN|uniref:SPOR domain-containing protein n=1 Tax=Hyphococcus sp. TaxID=2038636 RepID=UPI003D0FC836
MANAAQEEAFEEDYQEYDEFDDDEEDRGLSGFAVLIMGIVMIGAFVSVVWIAYKQGMKVGRDGGAIETPYVAADPEPIKIETAEDGTPVADRQVYDAIDGEAGEPVTTLAEGPEEPVTRTANDTIGTLAAEAEQAASEMSDEVNDRLASLQAEDAEALDNNPVEEEPRDTAPPTVSVTTPSVAPASTAAASSPASGTHVVQVGAFRSNDEAMAQWARMQTKLGDYLDGKGPDVERADLGDRGVYHRLRVGPFDSADAAKTYCAGLKERGQDCLIKSL